MIRVGVIGAAGLAGGELIRLISQHPELKLTFLGGSSHVGQRPAELHPGLRFDLGLAVEPVPDDLGSRCDVVLLATPAPVSARLVARLADTVPCLIDLSGAFRIRDPELHHRWYPDVPRPDGLADRFVYGAPELVGDQLPGAALISLPGCYATAITLGLAPLVFGLGLTLRTVVIDGKSGSSGGGLQLRTADLHALRHGAIAPYAPTGHRHSAEVSDFLDRGKPGRVGRVAMSAYGVAQVRGLLASCYVFTDDDVDTRLLQRTYVRFYAGHPFVRVRRHAETLIPVPDPQAVLGSNYCDVTAMHDPDGGRIVVLAALDNLVKGAAGQAVQALNKRFSLPEQTGLTMQPLMPA
ncbi:N-acetyl-gamma-glutamyl-phosphate/N-acetyl-gamma- aminoadipyl-phosphate reductase [Actinoplanes cyaneus]|uniref:N-acetyl-gamma-glutamyl-phosphate reductase n=1 Tax=Actinoplanes cyaneus TaxID=52696 RepID=A0A919IGJ5_9ACTN|nr:N-acetyl-gamma-glutamyl-phosphate reductase [Actinoplanes cyaneus]MCW2137831.1 N-acetyl-gamma-glutamyl-phosphate reductase [Actinoplanes cyaneus]GID64962.1 N-acetyl-gamma-glutamyl-phosphate/N-acetyl-gamma- aminoadipyl-phosphate reductase [Actinoplanes cyaneus]